MASYRFEVRDLGAILPGEPRRWAFRGISFSLEAGEHLLVLGANGAGKSSLLRCLAGLNRPAEGSWAHVGGRGRTGWLTAHTSHHLFLATVHEDLVFSPCNRGEKPEEWRPRLERVAHALGLQSFWERSAQTLSQGERQRAAVGAMLMDQPDLLLLDEPSLGLDAPSRRHLATLLEGMGGMSMVLATHDLAWGRRLCSRFIILHQGRVVAEGGMDRLDALGEPSLEAWGLR